MYIVSKQTPIDVSTLEPSPNVKKALKFSSISKSTTSNRIFTNYNHLEAKDVIFKLLKHPVIGLGNFIYQLRRGKILIATVSESASIITGYKTLRNVYGLVIHEKDLARFNTLGNLSSYQSFIEAETFFGSTFEPVVLEDNKLFLIDTYIALKGVFNGQKDYKQHLFNSPRLQRLASSSHRIQGVPVLKLLALCEFDDVMGGRLLEIHRQLGNTLGMKKLKTMFPNVTASDFLLDLVNQVIVHPEKLEVIQKLRDKQFALMDELKHL